MGCITPAFGGSSDSNENTRHLMKPLVDNFTKCRMTREEEATLAKRIHQGDEDALVSLVMANMYEAMCYTKFVCRGSLDEATRVSLCYQELCMSGRRFNSERQRFFAFAKAGLRGRMKTYRSSLNVVRNAKEVVSTDSITGLRPTWKERLCYDRKEERDHEELLGGSVMPDHGGMLARDFVAEIKKRLRRVISEQQWMILDLTYQGGLSFPQIGTLLGLTRSAIHASHGHAMKKLRAAIKADKRLLI